MTATRPSRRKWPAERKQRFARGLPAKGWIIKNGAMNPYSHPGVPNIFEQAEGAVESFLELMGKK
jgi:hypothetical protein